jgi:phospholipid/cholesterol/gamma-HCH transport system substrate-binding protein
LQKIALENEHKALELIENCSELINNVKANIPDIMNQLKGISDIIKLKDNLDINSSLNKINSIIEKIDAGKGNLGKLLNDNSVYNNLKIILDTAKTGCDKLNQMRLMLDSHTESMNGDAEKYEFKNSKAYLNLWFFPRLDYFYVTGLSYSQKGYISRNIVYADFFDEKDRPIYPSKLIEYHNPNDFFSRAHFKNEKLDSLSLNLQVGKLFDNYNISLRAGLFEGYPGFAIDYYIPFVTDSLKWISTFEAWDFKGRNRVFHDVRPHLKWLNRFFVTSNIYLTFGANDFISKYNKNIFLGIGIRFDDNTLKDDLKYIYYKTAFARTMN